MAKNSNSNSADASKSVADFWEKCSEFQKQSFDEWQETFAKYSNSQDSWKQWNEWQDAVKGINWGDLANQWSNPNTSAEKLKALGELHSQNWQEYSSAQQEWSQKWTQSQQQAAEKVRGAYQGSVWSTDPQTSVTQFFDANVNAYQAIKEQAQQQADLFTEAQTAYFNFMKKAFQTATNTPA